MRRLSDHDLRMANILSKGEIYQQAAQGRRRGAILCCAANTVAIAATLFGELAPALIWFASAWLFLKATESASSLVRRLEGR